LIAGFFFVGLCEELPQIGEAIMYAHSRSR
jgi:hypothetical protein